MILAALLACTTPTPARAALQVPLAELAWVTGHWRGEQAEEQWMPPRGGSMLGTGRVVVDDQTVFHEYLRIEQTAAGTVRYHASPNGKGSTPFELVEKVGTRAVFENPAHDFPQRIVYELDGATLTTRVSRIGEEGEANPMDRAL